LPPTSDTSLPKLKNIKEKMNTQSPTKKPLTGLIRELSLELKIKDNADLVGPFPPPETLKEPGTWTKMNYPFYLNNNWLTVLVSFTEIWDVTEETHTALWDTFKRKV
jgi:hypothetical protein